ncbi:MAG: hypothetical protein O7C03_06725 [Gammaproteobacteria bacterium]|nr:hypothetical protein [Gammaproteobacteria bacterium]
MIPDSSNLKATMLIEYPDIVQVAGHAPVFAIADHPHYSRPGVSLDGDLLGSLLDDLA